MRESGCINHYESVMLADTKAKTVTSNLLQLTVLCAVPIQPRSINIIKYNCHCHNELLENDKGNINCPFHGKYKNL